MTASSIGLFACRVQPIGLPGAAAVAPFNNNNNNNNSRLSALPQQQQQQQQQQDMSTRVIIRPTADAVRRVTRNLFGKPDHGEIDKMICTEYDKNCAHVRQRYNFDIRNAQDVENQVKANENNSVGKPLPTLIAQEFEEQQLSAKRQKKCNNLSQPQPTNDNNQDDKDDDDDNDRRKHCPSAEKTPQPAITTELAKSCDQKIKSQRKLISSSPTLCKTIGASVNNERLNAMSKQKLLTDCFNMRKSSSISVKQHQQQHSSKRHQQKQENRQVLADDPVSIGEEVVATNVMLSLQITATTADSLHA